jgi:DNA repair exonuclease SbcCD ATPase subunit
MEGVNEPELLEKRFEKLAEKYHKLRAHYEMTKKQLELANQQILGKSENTVPESAGPSGIGLTGIFQVFKGNQENHGKLKDLEEKYQVMEEELERKIGENEQLVMELSDLKRSMNSMEENQERLKQENLGISREHGILEKQVGEKDSEISRLSSELEKIQEIHAREKEEFNESVKLKEWGINSLTQELSAAKLYLSESERSRFEESEIFGAKFDLLTLQSRSEQESLQAQLTTSQNRIETLEKELQNSLTTSQSSAITNFDQIELLQSTGQAQAELKSLTDRYNELSKKCNYLCSTVIVQQRIEIDQISSSLKMAETERDKFREELSTVKQATTEQIEILTENLLKLQLQLNDCLNPEKTCGYCGLFTECNILNICSKCNQGGFLASLNLS